MTYSYRLPSGDQFAEMITNKIAPAAFIDLINIVNEDGRYNNPEIVRKFTEIIDCLRQTLLNKSMEPIEFHKILVENIKQIVEFEQDSPEHVLVEQATFSYSEFVGNGVSSDEHREAA